MEQGSEFKSLATSLLPLLQTAGAEILRHYSSVNPTDVHIKEDRSPLTAADLASHDILMAGLEELTPSIPVLSEEAAIPHLSERQHWSQLWLVDPLDGTREFIDANDQFCINLALIDNGEPLLGLIYSPVSRLCYVGIIGEGAWRIENDVWHGLNCRKMGHSEQTVLVAGSRRFTDDMLACEDGLKEDLASVVRLAMGSAMKFCQLADGNADIYPCFGPTSEWDTAAGQAIVEAAGGQMVSLDFKTFRYNQRESVLNGGFFVFADREYAWEQLIRSQRKRHSATSDEDKVLKSA